MSCIACGNSNINFHRDLSLMEAGWRCPKCGYLNLYNPKDPIGMNKETAIECVEGRLRVSRWAANEPFEEAKKRYGSDRTTKRSLAEAKEKVEQLESCLKWLKGL